MLTLYYILILFLMLTLYFILILFLMLTLYYILILFLMLLSSGQFGVLAPNFKFICVSNIFVLNDEGYYRNVSCAHNSISTFLLFHLILN